MRGKKPTNESPVAVPEMRGFGLGFPEGREDAIAGCELCDMPALGGKDVEHVRVRSSAEVREGRSGTLS
jgi:hypothetical protein